MKTDNTELFTSGPVPRAVLALVIPTAISQLITVVYNMADTFFIGQLGDSNQVAAASLALPLFLLTTGMANLREVLSSVFVDFSHNLLGVSLIS